MSRRPQRTRSDATRIPGRESLRQAAEGAFRTMSCGASRPRGTIVVMESAERSPISPQELDSIAAGSRILRPTNITMRAQ